MDSRIDFELEKILECPICQGAGGFTEEIFDSWENDYIQQSYQCGTCGGSGFKNQAQINAICDANSKELVRLGMAKANRMDDGEDFFTTPLIPAEESGDFPF